ACGYTLYIPTASKTIKVIWNSFTLYQIPFVSVQVFKNGNDSITLVARLFFKRDASSDHPAIVAPEIVGLQKQKDSSTGLISDGNALLLRGSFSEQETRAGQSPRPNEHPPLLCIETRIFQQLKTERIRKECDRLVVIPYYQRYVSNPL